MNDRELIREFLATPTDPNLADVGRDLFAALSGKAIKERAQRFEAIVSKNAALRTRTEKALRKSGIYNQEIRGAVGHRNSELSRKIDALEKIQREKGIIPNRGPIRVPDPLYFEKQKKLNEAIRQADLRRKAAKKRMQPKPRPPRPGH